MYKIFFPDRFTESLMALLYKYNIAPARLKDEDMKTYLRYFIENGSYIDEIFEGQYDNMSNLAIWKTNFMDDCLPDEKVFTSRKASYLCTIYMLLFVIKTDLQEGNLYETEKLQNMSLNASTINTFMSSLIMDFDFERHNELDFNANYMPSPMLTEYIGGMYKTELLKQQYMEILGQKTIVESELIELNRKIDREILVTGISFMQIQAILLLIESSKLYPAYVRKIAKSILLIFKEMLADSRIEKIEIDSAISAGVIRQGIRKTTGMKIFFSLENCDRYCLRIDFPHEGAEYLHLNLHEPHRQTAIPLNYKQYSMLKKQYGDLSNLFFYFGNMYWFRYDFIEKLNKYSLIEGCENNNSSFIADIKAVFFRQSHYRLFDDNITKDNMVDFIAEFGKALIHTQIYETSYFCTETENIDDKLTKIKLRDIFISVFALYQRFYLEEKIFPKSYKIGYDKLKEKLLNALFTSFSSEVAPLGEYAEFEEMRLEDIFFLLYDIINDSEN